VKLSKAVSIAAATLGLLSGATTVFASEVACVGKNVEIKISDIETGKISISGSQGSLANVEITRLSNRKVLRAQSFKSKMVINFWSHGRSLMDQTTQAKVALRRENNGPRKILGKSGFAFYSSSSPAEVFDGDNDTFAVIHGQTVDLNCDWN
jgi:hypothetical protein